MKTTTQVVVAAAWMLNGSASAFSVDLSRREAIQAAIAGAAAVGPALISVFPANAMPSEETPRVVTRMGGLLVRNMMRIRRKSTYRIEKATTKCLMVLYEPKSFHFL